VRLNPKVTEDPAFYATQCSEYAPELFGSLCELPLEHEGPHQCFDRGFAPVVRAWIVESGKRRWLGDMASAPSRTWVGRVLPYDEGEWEK
jgi:hypothetical protein